MQMHTGPAIEHRWTRSVAIQEGSPNAAHFLREMWTFSVSKFKMQYRSNKIHHTPMDRVIGKLI